MQAIHQLDKTNKVFQSFLKAAKTDPRTRKLPLDSFISIPIQRICKYPLLLRELVKNTPEDEPHRAVSSSIRHKVKFVDSLKGTRTHFRSCARWSYVSHCLMFLVINDKKANYENQQKIFQIAASLGDSLPEDLVLVQPARRLIKEAR